MKLVLAAALVAAFALPAYAADKTDAEREQCDAIGHAIADEEPAAGALTQMLEDGHFDRMLEVAGGTDFAVVTGTTKDALDKYEAARKTLVASLWEFRKAASEASSELTACSGRTGPWLE